MLSTNNQGTKVTDFNITPESHIKITTVNKMITN